MLSRISFRRPSLALAGILIAIGGCAESPSAPAQPEFVLRGAHARFSISGTASAVIDQRGGSLVSPAGDRIVFPAGALSGPTQISITSDETYVGVELQPHGLTFPEGHLPVLQLNTAGSNAGAYQRISVSYVNESGSVAEILPATTGNNRASTNLHHFSGYMASGY
ncbi:MAG TPA: hypothetical protein VF092_13965 [Longimicrobium sp.]